MTLHLMPRFSERRRTIAADDARWDELAALREDMAAIENRKDCIEKRYGLAIPAAVADACDALDRAADALGKRAGELEDGDA